MSSAEGIKLPNLGGTKIRACRARKKHNMLGIDKDVRDLAGDMSRERDEPRRSAFLLKLPGHFEQLAINVKALPGYECEIGTHGRSVDPGPDTTDDRPMRPSMCSSLNDREEHQLEPQARRTGEGSGIRQP